MRSFWLILAFAAGCTRPLSGGDCSQLNESDCRADDACSVFTCPNCSGGSTFVGCYDKGHPLPGFGCPAYACASCHGLDRSSCTGQPGFGCHPAGCCGAFTGCLDPAEPAPVCTAACVSCDGLPEQTCVARSDCRADYCPSCDPNHASFVRCANPGEPMGDCTPPPCPPPPSCGQVPDETSCALRSDCHGVFEPAACGCANCCCTPFNHCASGGKADCHGPAACNQVPPDCSNSACSGAFTVAYTNGCYEGCVRTTECN